MTIAPGANLRRVAMRFHGMMTGKGLTMQTTKSPSEAYTLPAGKVQISFSGGRTSGYMLHQIAEANGGIPEGRVEVIFANTGREMPQTLDFVAEVAQRWQIPVTWVEYMPDAPWFAVVGRQGAAENGEPFDALIDKRRYLPNQQSRFCTQELKIRPAKRYLVAQGWKRWTAAIGIRADEPSRIKRDPQRERWQRWYPLADAGVSKHDVAAFWRAQPFDLRLPNVRGNTALGNCDGCFLKSQASRAALLRDMPDRAAWWEAAEARVGKINRLKRAAKQNAQFNKRESWAELRGFIERQGDWIFNAEDALCQRDEGECTE